MGSTMPYFHDQDTDTAKRLFQEALTETGVSREQLPPIILSYSTSDRNHKIAQAVQQQWNHCFGIQVQLQNYEGKVLYEHLSHGQYQIAIGSWFADIQDPINFLEVFKRKDNGTNNTGWENPEFEALLTASDQISDYLQRKKLLLQAETLLMHEMPIAPLYFFTFNFLKRDDIKNASVSALGVIDFKYASIAQP